MERNPATMKTRARILRHRMTDAERRLWYYLRNRQLQGFKFRRQFVIGSYIVDFVCLSARLIVEADGGQHEDQHRRDEYRTAYLESRGYRVLRFWNHEILNQTEDVLAQIHDALDERSSFPSGEKNRVRE